MTEHTFQAQFVKDLIAPVSPNSSKRFAVYRNNVFVGLVDALHARYPAIVNAVGLEFFNALARDYVSQYQPRSPVMMEYGAEFPEFIAAFQPLRDYSWLVDLARLENAMTKIYHAQDQIPISAHAFAQLSTEMLTNLRIEFVDAATLMISDYPLVTLWKMNTGQIEPAPVDDIPSEAAFVYRDHFDVKVQALRHDDAVFLNALYSGENFSEAIRVAEQSNAHFDPQSAFELIFKLGVIASVNAEPLEMN